MMYSIGEKVYVPDFKTTGFIERKGIFSHWMVTIPGFTLPFDEQELEKITNTTNHDTHNTE